MKILRIIFENSEFSINGMDTDFDVLLFQTEFRRKRQKISEIRESVEMKLFKNQILSQKLGME